MLFGAGAVYQLVAILQLSRSPFFGNPILDARYQVEWAFALASGYDPHPTFFQSPLFSYALALFLKLFGWQPWGIVLVQWALLLGVAVLVLLALGRLGVERPIRLVLFAVALFHPLYPYYAAMLHKTAVEIFVHAAVLYLGVRVLTDVEVGWRSIVLAALFGLICGLASLVRATFQAVAILPVLFLRANRVRRIAAIAAGFVVPLAWASIHNYRGADEWVPLQTSFGFTLFLGNNPWNPEGGQMLVPGLSNKPLQEEASSKEYAERMSGRPLSIREVNRFFVDEVWKFVRTQPARFSAAQLRKIYWYFHREELPDNDCYRCLARDVPALALSPLNWGWIVLVALPALAVVVASWFWERRAPPAALFAVAYAVALLSMILVFYVSSRLRIGHVAAWLVVAGLGLHQAKVHWPERRRAILVLLIAGLLPGMILLNQPLPEYPPDDATLKFAWMHADLDQFDRAAAAARTLQDAGRREALLRVIEELRAAPPDRPRHLLSPLLPPRR
jgi:hypothetical protein